MSVRIRCNQYTYILNNGQINLRMYSSMICYQLLIHVLKREKINDTTFNIRNQRKTKYQNKEFDKKTARALKRRPPRFASGCSPYVNVQDNDRQNYGTHFWVVYMEQCLTHNRTCVYFHIVVLQSNSSTIRTCFSTAVLNFNRPLLKCNWQGISKDCVFHTPPRRCKQNK